MSVARENSTVVLDAEEAYARWAPSYDQTPNPLTTLEERLIAPMLGEFAGRDVVDLGCGTGRWLQRLQSIGPRSLVGVDTSPAMLAEAGRKCLLSTSLIEAACTSTPLPSRSSDCVLASFLLSYVRGISRFAAEAARILRRDGTVIVSDLHPDTPSYGWRRTFRTGGDLFEIATFPYTTATLVSTMTSEGFALEQLSEPGFGKEEAAIFYANGMADQFRRVMFRPVIYWARFSKKVN
jgi:ubiquinone/menaquinone biosynthesis C-methylase UbiE